jgi:hypothetical protein
MSKELSEKVIDVLSLGIDRPEHELFDRRWQRSNDMTP